MILVQINPILLSDNFTDGDGDGRTVLSSATSRRLKLPNGTVLVDKTQAGDKWSYRIEGLPLFPVPIAASVQPAPRVHAPVVPAVTAPAVSKTGVSMHKRYSGEVVKNMTMADLLLTRCGGIVRATNADIDGLTIERFDLVEARYIGGVIRSVALLGGRLNRITMRQGRYRASTKLNAKGQIESAITSRGDVYAGITLAGKSATDFGSGFLFEDLDLEGFYCAYTNPQPGDYPNCDGIAIEAKYTDGVIRRVRIAKTADGGIDIKGLRWRLEHITLEDCARGIRRWAPGVDGPIKSVRPKKCHFHMLSSGEWVQEFTQPISDDPTTPLVYFDAPGTVRILDWDPSGIDLSKQVLAQKRAGRGKCTLILPGRPPIVI